jgi:ABC-2 type transport system ATP-binding protein
LLRLPGGAAQIATDAIDDAQLGPWADTPASDLSGGLRQRLNVAVGLLGDPPVLVLDEPTTGVDLTHRVAMFDVLRARARAGCAVLCATHSLEDAAGADRAVVLVDGRVAYEGTLAGIAHVGSPAQRAAQHDPAGSTSLDPVSRGLLRLWAGGRDQ